MEFLSLQKAKLFSNMEIEDIKTFLQSVNYNLKLFEKGTYLIMAGQKTENIGIFIRGKAQAQKHTVFGRSFTIANLICGSVFGDLLALGNAASPVSIFALSECEVLFIPVKDIVTNAQHVKVLKNMVREVSDKYFSLDSRIDLLLEKSLRIRILAFLKGRELKLGKASFTLSLSRQALADYLGCERSALSRELSRMSKDGLINYKKNCFELLCKMPID